MDSEDQQLKTSRPMGGFDGIALKGQAISEQKIWPLFMRQEDECDEVTEARTDRLRDRETYATATDTVESFHCAIGPVLNIAQVFGVFPLSGVRSSSPSRLRFKAFSFLTVYSVVASIMVLLVTGISVIYMLKTLNAATLQQEGGIGAATVGAVFYGNCLLGGVLFFRLSTRWISFQREWRMMELRIDSDPKEIPRLRWKFFFMSAGVLLLALVEHILSVFNNVDGYDWSATNSTFPNFLQAYTLRSHAFIFDIVDYNFSFGLYIFVVSKLATFTWNFTDLFVMLVATGLAERYKSLNKKLASTVAKYRSTLDWCKLREDYAILSCMVKKVDNYISPIILLSFSNNLYFICLQLFNGLSISEDKSLVCAVYFFGSFAFLIGRTCAVTLLTARIHDQSKKALPYLYSCTPANYNIEAQRLEYQLSTDDVFLTGLRFFSITRNFMLAVAGAIVTYEIVLLQLNGMK